ncbi:MAG: DNA recombination protein RmuC [Crocinitomicaceae bacterium]
MYLELFLVVVALIAGFAAFWFFRENLQSVAAKTQWMNDFQLVSKEKEEIQNQFIRTKAENDLYQKQLHDEKESFVEQKEFLTQQLQLLGKDLVEQGSKTLKMESHQKLNELLHPFKEKLDQFEKEVRDNHKRDIEQYSNMSAVVRTLSEQHDKMKSTAQNLVDALRGENKVQGDWGEMALERILESSGLIKGQEYETQSSFRDEEGNLQRPDVVIQLPENKKIIIDSKVSLRAFERYINEEDSVLKKEALKDHILSLKTHIKQLGEKDYSHLTDINSPEFVLLFIPLESSFALAVKEEPDLYELAMKQKIVLVTPSTLLATLKTVDSIWKHERTNKNAQVIAEQAGRLYDKFVAFVADLEKVGKKQEEASDAYDKAMNKLKTGNGNLMISAEKLKILGVKTKKNLDNKNLLEENDHEED